MSIYTPSYHLNSIQPDHAKWQSPPFKSGQPYADTCHYPYKHICTNLPPQVPLTTANQKMAATLSILLACSWLTHQPPSHFVGAPRRIHLHLLQQQREPSPFAWPPFRTCSVSHSSIHAANQRHHHRPQLQCLHYSNYHELEEKRSTVNESAPQAWSHHHPCAPAAIAEDSIVTHSSAYTCEREWTRTESTSIATKFTPPPPRNHHHEPAPAAEEQPSLQLRQQPDGGGNPNSDMKEGEGYHVSSCQWTVK